MHVLFILCSCIDQLFHYITYLGVVVKCSYSPLLLCCHHMQGYIRFRQSGSVDAVVKSEGLKDVTFEGVQGNVEKAVCR